MPSSETYKQTRGSSALLAVLLGSILLILSGCNHHDCDGDDGMAEVAPATPAPSPIHAAPPQPAAPVPTPGPGRPQDDSHEAVKVDDARLENAYRITPKIYAGAQPKDSAAFQALKELGIRTILSVDGVSPDVEAAHRVGLPYVHLPFGYDGIPPDRALQIARALEELPGPIYVHCHHGMHRAPAGAAIGCVISGMLTNAQALADMHVFGTGANYLGLWASVRNARAITPEELKQVKVEYREISPIPPLAEAMVQLDGIIDTLKDCKAAGWQAPKEHPDADPAHEALKMREIFTELLRTDEVKARPDDFKGWMNNAQKLAGELEDGLRAHSKDASADGVNAKLLSIQNNCATCHKVYRNVPQK